VLKNMKMKSDYIGHIIMDKNKMPVTLTNEAILAIKEVTNPGEGLRVAVVGGGCAGYSYALELKPEDDIDNEDIISEYDGLKVWIDPHSGEMLRGTIIDYVKAFQKTGFVFNNPNANQRCGCGSSFA